MSLAVFNLPDVGEGLTEAEIVSWKVAAGDQVRVNQVICEIETAKSIVELPCPFAGTIEKLFAKEGDTVLVGNPIISVQAEGNILVAGPATSTIPIISESDTMHEAVADVASSVASDETKPNLVGYGSAGHGATRRKRSGAVATASLANAIPTATSAIPSALSGDVIAKPPIRKLAKDLNVDLSRVVATGPAGEITREDVVNAATQASVFRNLTTPAIPSEREEGLGGGVGGAGLVGADGVAGQSHKAGVAQRVAEHIDEAAAGGGAALGEVAQVDEGDLPTGLQRDGAGAERRRGGVESRARRQSAIHGGSRFWRAAIPRAGRHQRASSPQRRGSGGSVGPSPGFRQRFCQHDPGQPGAPGPR